MQGRINKVYLELKRNCLDAFFVAHGPNLRYLCGYEGKDSFLLLAKSRAFLFVDSRSIEEARRIFAGSRISVKLIQKNIYQEVAVVSRKLKLTKIGFETKVLSFYDYSSLSKLLGKDQKLVANLALLEDLRMLKEKQEISKIKKATEMAIDVVNQAKKLIRPGLTELEAAFIIEGMIKQYKTKPSFDIIVASGKNTCEPHHIVNKRVIHKNEPLMLDLGLDYEGYKSDLTRTWFFGKITPAFSKIYSIVKEAQECAIKAIKPGVEISEIDKLARDYITKKGFGKYFTHSLGHGVGLEVHEKPGINSKNSNFLKEGMVFSVEPAIYIPGKFGIRLEDLVVVTKKGCECLSGSLNK